MNKHNEKVKSGVAECQSADSIRSENELINLAYEKPVLIAYGDVRDITLGPSPGFGESGAGVFFLQP